MNLFDIDYKIETEHLKKQLEIYESTKKYITLPDGKTIGISQYSTVWDQLTPEFFRHISLFPNNYIFEPEREKRNEYRLQLDGLIKLIDNTDTTEQDLLKFINSNMYYFIIASVLRKYDFGHHVRYLFKEFQLGTSYKPDYVLIGGASGGLRIIFIELENIHENITMRDGSFGETIRKGINQIEDWKTWIDQNFLYIKENLEKYVGKHESLPKELINFDSTRMNYLVIAGRRTHYNDKTYILRRRAEKNNIRIWHYDNLIDTFKSLIQQCAY